MFKFFKRKKIIPLSYTTDLHSHLIPGMDDGVKTMDESISLIRTLEDRGFKRLVTTPHIMSHRYPNSSQTILKGLKQLRHVIEREKIDIELYAAAEYYLDEYFLECIKKDDILSFGQNYLLFEMSYTVKPINFDQIIFAIISAGYIPVLAHPERYKFMHHDLKAYQKLKKQGIYFQVNLNSLGGFYTRDIEKTAYMLLDNGLIDFIGSDIHNENYLKHYNQNLSSNIMKKVLEKNTILNDKLYL